MPKFDARGFELYYETHGGGDGLPLVLIMGVGASCQGWNVLTVPELSKDRLNVIFDNRGAGRSSDPGTEFTTQDLAADTLAGRSRRSWRSRTRIAYRRSPWSVAAAASMRSAAC
jgi:pimeloyl-ACP methyl ester carboxylesterase